MRYPFTENKTSSGHRIRTFLASVDDEELIWHRDDEARRVKVLSAGGWFLQLDDEIPQELKPNETYFIPRHAWHRVLKKKTIQDLVVEITPVIDHQ